MKQAPHTFTLSLAMAAPPGALEKWLAAAAPGHRVVYASGIDLPRDEAGVRLVKRWVDAGKVTTFQRRDPADARRFEFIAQRIEESSPSVRLQHALRAHAVRSPRTCKQRDALLGLLRQRANRRELCPSNAAIAAALELGSGAKGRARASYLMRLLEADGAIAIENNGRNAARVVTVLAGGHACGKRTRCSGRGFATAARAEKNPSGEKR